jgi:hypothetical protein
MTATLTVRTEGRVLFAEIAAPPMNLFRYLSASRLVSITRSKVACAR